MEATADLRPASLYLIKFGSVCRSPGSHSSSVPVTHRLFNRRQVTASCPTLMSRHGLNQNTARCRRRTEDVIFSVITQFIQVVVNTGEKGRVLTHRVVTDPKDTLLKQAQGGIERQNHWITIGMTSLFLFSVRNKQPDGTCNSDFCRRHKQSTCDSNYDTYPLPPRLYNTYFYLQHSLYTFNTF